MTGKLLEFFRSDRWSLILSIIPLCFCLFLFSGCKNTSSNPTQSLLSSDFTVEERLALLPSEDRKALEVFWRLVITEYAFAYTLVGDKPCSIACYKNLTEQSLLDLQTLYRFSSLKEGLRVWAKWKHLFPRDNFVMREVRSDSSKMVTIILINKKVLSKLLDQYLPELLGSLQLEMSHEEVLQRLCEDDLFLSKSIERSDVLGLLLGYGKVNAKSFKRRDDLSSQLAAWLLPPYQGEALNGLNEDGMMFVEGSETSETKARLPFSASSLKEGVIELNDLISSLEPFELPGSALFVEEIQSPLFVGVLQDPETQDLIHRYELARLKVIKTFSKSFLNGKSFSEKALDCWLTQG